MNDRRPRLYLDLDGPILDVRRRYGLLHESLMRASDGEPIDAATYWTMKRQARPDRDLVAERLTPSAMQTYLSRRMELIESPEWLEHDAVQPGALEAVTRLRAAWRIVIVTLRTNRDGLMKQLARLGVADCVDAVLSGGGGKAQVKIDLVNSNEPTNHRGWFVGDTELDIEAGRMLGQQTCGLTCGIRERGLLEAARPDWLLNSLSEFADRLLVGPLTPTEAAR